MKKNAHIAPPIKYFPASSKWYNKTRKGKKHIQMEDTKLFSFAEKKIDHIYRKFQLQKYTTTKGNCGKDQFSFQCQRRAMPKNAQTAKDCTVALISHARR